MYFDTRYNKSYSNDYDYYGYNDYDQNYSYNQYNNYKDIYEDDYKDDYKDDNEDLKNDYNEENYYNENNDYYDNDNKELDKNLSKDVDEDLAEYFSDAHIFSSKKQSNKKRNKRIIYKVDDKIMVLINKVQNKGQILFGPYDVNKKQYYQIELTDGNIIEADEKHISYQ